MADGLGELDMTDQSAPAAPAMTQRQWVAVGLLALTVAVMLAMGAAAYAVITGGQAETSKLTLLVIGGVVALVLMITLIATIYSLLGLTDSSQAMALPEGSIRAVIALLLLVLFAMLAVFFYDGLQSGGSRTTLQNLSEADLVAFLAQHPNAPNLSVTLVGDKSAGSAAGADSGAPAPSNNGSAASSAAAAAAGGAAGSTGAKPPARYNVTYGGGNPNADDFAKQLITALGTLLTSVVSFYFGGKTATSAAAAASQQAAAAAAGPPAPPGP